MLLNLFTALFTAALTYGATAALMVGLGTPAPASLPNGCEDVRNPQCVPRAEDDRGTGRLEARCRRGSRDCFPKDLAEPV